MEPWTGQGGILRGDLPAAAVRRPRVLLQGRAVLLGHDRGSRLGARGQGCERVRTLQEGAGPDGQADPSGGASMGEDTGRRGPAGVEEPKTARCPECRTMSRYSHKSG